MIRTKVTLSERERETTEHTEKERFYRSLAKSAAALLEGERDFLANMANLSALLFQELPDVNWAGFYLLKGQDLVLGPFQGKPACTRIGPGKGVCGAAAEKRETVIVENVNEFPGHIACDAALEIGDRRAADQVRAAARRAGYRQRDFRPLRRRGPSRAGRDCPIVAGRIG